MRRVRFRELVTKVVAALHGWEASRGRSVRREYAAIEVYDECNPATRRPADSECEWRCLILNRSARLYHDNSQSEIPPP